MKYTEKNRRIIQALQVRAVYKLVRYVTVILLAWLVPFGSVEATEVRLALILDKSASMEGEKIRALREACKLATALLDGSVTLIAFDSNAHRSPTLPINDVASRTKVNGLIDQIGVSGDTNYLDALKELNQLPRGTVAIFCSDGLNRHGTPSQVTDLARSAPGPIHTIAIGAESGAIDLLTQIAATSQGSAVRIDNPQQLIETLVRIAMRIGDYQAYEPRTASLDFDGVVGEFIAIGIDSAPAVAVRNTAGEKSSQLRSPWLTHIASLREQVVVRRFRIDGQKDLRVTATETRSSLGRLARILRRDLPNLELFIRDKQGDNIPKSMQFPVDLVFRLPDGTLCDSVPQSIKGHVELRDAVTGAILDKKPAIRTADGKRLQAMLQAPSVEGKAVTIVGEITDSSSGHEFHQQEQVTAITRELSPGLIFPESQFGKDFGQQSSNSGDISLGTVDIQTNRTDGLAWNVVVADMTDGSRIIPVKTKVEQISPTKDAPARIELFASIGTVRPGTYTGYLQFDPQSNAYVANRFARLPFHVQIVAPIESSGSLDLGELEIGTPSVVTVAIKNHAKALNATLKVAEVEFDGGTIIIETPKSVRLKQNAITTFDVRVTISELVQSRGVKIKTPLQIFWSEDSDPLVVPVVIGIGKVLAPPVITPDKVTIRARPSQDICNFEIKVRVSPTFSLPSRVKATLNPFNAFDGSRSDIATDIKITNEGKLTKAHREVGISGILIPPRNVGEFSTTLDIETAHGITTVPVLLKVEK
jgi:hypothetical protein